MRLIDILFRKRKIQYFLEKSMSFYNAHLYSEDRCLQYLFDLRFPHARCPKCGRKNAYHRTRNKQCFTCRCGKSHLFPRKGTMFGSSHLPLLTWIHCIFLLTRSKKKDVTIHALAGLLNIAYPTAWRMKTKITKRLGKSALTKQKRVTFEDVMKKCAGTMTK